MSIQYFATDRLAPSSTVMGRADPELVNGCVQHPHVPATHALAAQVGASVSHVRGTEHHAAADHVAALPAHTVYIRLDDQQTSDGSRTVSSIYESVMAKLGGATPIGADGQPRIFLTGFGVATTYSDYRLNVGHPVVDANNFPFLQSLAVLNQLTSFTFQGCYEARTIDQYTAGVQLGMLMASGLRSDHKGYIRKWLNEAGYYDIDTQDAVAQQLLHNHQTFHIDCAAPFLMRTGPVDIRAFRNMPFRARMRIGTDANMGWGVGAYAAASPANVVPKTVQDSYLYARVIVIPADLAVDARILPRPPMKTIVPLVQDKPLIVTWNTGATAGFNQARVSLAEDGFYFTQMMAMTWIVQDQNTNAVHGPFSSTVAGRDQYPFRQFPNGAPRYTVGGAANFPNPGVPVILTMNQAQKPTASTQPALQLEHAAHLDEDRHIRDAMSTLQTYSHHASLPGSMTNDGLMSLPQLAAVGLQIQSATLTASFEVGAGVTTARHCPIAPAANEWRTHVFPVKACIASFEGGELRIYIPEYQK